MSFCKKCTSHVSQTLVLKEVHPKPCEEMKGPPHLFIFGIMHHWPLSSLLSVDRMARAHDWQPAAFATHRFSQQLACKRRSIAPRKVQWPGDKTGGGGGARKKHLYPHALGFPFGNGLFSSQTLQSSSPHWEEGTVHRVLHSCAVGDFQQLVWTLWAKASVVPAPHSRLACVHFGSLLLYMGKPYGETKPTKRGDCATYLRSVVSRPYFRPTQNVHFAGPRYPRWFRRSPIPCGQGSVGVVPERLLCFVEPQFRSAPVTNPGLHEKSM